MNDGRDLPEPTTGSVSMSAGALLRSAREATGLHIAALAVSMKVPVKKLEALESDRLDLLPDVVFVRALASSVCRALKIDAAPVLARLPQALVPRLEVVEQQSTTPFYTSGQERRLVLKGLVGKPTVSAVVVLLMAAAVIVFMPQNLTEEKSDEPVQSFLGGAIKPGEVAAEKLDTTATQMLPQLPLDQSVQQTPVPAVKFDVDAKVGQAKPQELQEKLQDEAETTIEIRARGVSWVDVSNSKGASLLRKTMTAGESLKVAGAGPLSVTLGRADSAEVWVGNKIFQTSGFTKENVAKFEVR